MKTSKKKIPISLPFIDQDDINSVIDTLQSKWIVQGPKTKKFEELFADFTKSKYAVAVSSCTTALHLSLESLGILNTKVIVPSFTFIATANAVEYTGSQVVFCDVNLETFNIDEKQIIRITEKEKNISAVIPVNLFGLCSNMIEIKKIASYYNIKVIEDCACSFGSYINNIHSGNFGDCGCFSFHPRKIITTGEGGMIITNNQEIYEKLLRLRNHGAELSDFQRHNSSFSFLLPEYNLRGYNYRITDIQASLGISQIQKANELLEARKKIALKYIEFFKSNSYKGKTLSKFFQLPTTPEGYIHSYQSFVILFSPDDSIFDPNLSSSRKKGIIDEWNSKRNQLMLELENLGISTRQGTHAVHTLGYYRKKYSINPEDYINSYAADKLSISLPLYFGLSDDDINYVLDCFISCLPKVI